MQEEINYSTLNDQPIHNNYSVGYLSLIDEKGPARRKINGEKEGSDTNADQLDAEKYYEGLSRFIQKCVTPMTIAIQGDWGSGKTSAMNYINRSLLLPVLKPDQSDHPNEVKCLTVYFNTWQYDQFSLSENLVFTMVQEITDQLLRDNDDKELLKEVQAVLIGLAKGAASTAVSVGDSFFSGFFGGTPVVSNMLLSAQNELSGRRKKSQGYSTVDSLRKIRDTFSKAVSEACRKHESDRVVIFIDDLDRINPVKALEIMEALKVLLECEKCVFVLAIDASVVINATKLKYGDHVSDKKARAFFDKIIQVPFHLPTHVFTTEKILSNYLSNYKETYKAENLEWEDFEKQFQSLVESSVGKNPRSIKRLLNTLSLILDINQVDSHSEDKDEDKDISFLTTTASLCAQNAYPEFYNDLIRAKDIDAFLEKVSSEGSSTASGQTNFVEEKKTAYKLDTVDEIQRFQGFLNIFVDIFSKANSLNSEILYDTISNAQVTIVNTEDEKNNTQNHTPNNDVKRFVKELFNATVTNKIQAKVDKDYKLSKEERFGDPIDKNYFSSIRITQGKHQGIYFFIAGCDPELNFYLSGDAFGLFPNDPGIGGITNDEFTSSQKDELKEIHRDFVRECKVISKEYGGDVTNMLAEDQVATATASFINLMKETAARVQKLLKN